MSAAGGNRWAAGSVTLVLARTRWLLDRAERCQRSAEAALTSSASLLRTSAARTASERSVCKTTACGHPVNMGADTGDEQREIDAEIAASAAAMAASPAGDAPGDAGRHATERRTRELDRRERHSMQREADADRRSTALDERDHDADQREHVADERDRVAGQREIDAEVVPAGSGDSRGRSSSGELGDPGELGMRLSSVARSLQDLTDVDTTLPAIVASAVDTVPGARYAGLSMVVTGRVMSKVVTAELVTRLDQAQHHIGDGPSITSLRQSRTILVRDMTGETRWPRFAALAAREGARSMLALQLFVRRDDLGVLTLYSPDANAFDEESEHVGLDFDTSTMIVFQAPT
jgi:hypothetical protein